MEKYRLYKNAWVSTLPPHLEKKLTKSETAYYLNRGGYFIRNTFNFDAKKETSFWFVIKDSFGGLDELSSGARRDIRKSLRTYNIRKISESELRKIGYEIFASAQESYKVKCDVISKEDFQKHVDEFEKSDDKEYWGAELMDTGEIVALGINTVGSDCCEYNILKCKPKALRNGTQPYYGLIYEMNRYYLEECGLKYVNDGARSITEHSNIQPFLMQKFKFRKAYCELNITYKWWVGIIVKFLFPFRKLIKTQKVRYLLNMEAMQRGEI